jgi:multimeric flavodoxin WrbA
MESKKTLLIVWHSRTGAARQMAQAAHEGALAVAAELAQQDRLCVIMKPAGDASASELLDADAYVFAAPENLAALSGAMKEFFDRTYYDVLDRLNGRPYALMIAAGSDGSGAVRQAERICQGWRLSKATPALIVNTNAQTPEAIRAEKTLKAEERDACFTVGGTLAALLL